MKKKQKTPVTDTPEKRYICHLQGAFLTASKTCLTAGGMKIGLSCSDLIDFMNAKEAMDGEDFWAVNQTGFDGWPRTPGITFSLFARDSARELAGAFVAKVAELIHAADPQNILFRLQEGQAVTQKELDDWRAAAFMKLHKALDLTRPAEFRRDCESLELKLGAEAEAYFVKRVQAESKGLGKLKQTEPKTSKEILALAELTKDPTLTNTQIAKKVGCHRTSLNAMPRFMQARKFVAEGKKDIPKGQKRKGKIEAFTDDE